jgi:sodium/potassium-transporting ATPase subunit alpha
MSIHQLYLGIVLWVVVIITCCLSYIQDRQSSDIMNSFRTLLPQVSIAINSRLPYSHHSFHFQNCKVVRDGFETRIPVEEVVVGDIVQVTAGDKVPADIRIIACSGLKVFVVH